MTLKRDILKSPIRTFTSYILVFFRKPLPKQVELVWPVDIVGEIVVHVHHHDVVLFSEEAHTWRQGDLRDHAARVCHVL